MTDHPQKRRSPRFRVHLEVSYASAREFVVEYAENLSSGGLFIKGGEGLQPLQEVSVELALPGAGTFRVETRVAHVLTAEVAERFGQSPGAGLEITRAPDGFAEAMTAYLLRLGRRTEVCVLVTDRTLGLSLGAAGYVVQRVEAPERVVLDIAHATLPVVAVVVSESEAAVYRKAVVGAGAGDIVCVCRDLGDMSDVLARIDLLIDS